MSRRPHWQWVFRLPLAALFVYAGTVKLFGISEFGQKVSEFGLVLDPLVTPTAWSVGIAEVLTGVALAANLRGSLAAVTLLLCVFIGVLIYGIALGLDMSCGCLGPLYRPSLPQQLAIDLGLLLWCGAIYWIERPGRFPQPATAADGGSRGEQRMAD